MALAFLLSNLIKTSTGAAGLARLHALIIDHNARPGSHQEARTVSSWLESMGISSSVDIVDWKGHDPWKLSNFESEARKRRYQYLTTLTRIHRIEHLLTGHHLDDQMETIIMRLMRGENPSLLALRGMLPVSAVPECETFRGIRNAEPAVPIESLFTQRERVDAPDAQPYLAALLEKRLGQQLYTLDGGIRGLNHGGVELHRPLLAFPKSALVATCEANGIPYVKDKTNFDPSFTRRNAIRVLRSDHKLPRALQDQSLLALAQTARDTLESISAQASKVLRDISILAFDFRSGVVHLRIPSTCVNLLGTDNNVAAYLLTKIASLVSATSTDEQEILAPGSIVSMLWKSVSNSEWNATGAGSPPKFTYNSVLLEALPSNRQVTGDATIWRLSRMPLTAKQREELSNGFRRSEKKSVASSKWLLWDWRYWIRIHVRSEKSRSLLKTRSIRVLPHHMMAQIKIRAYSIDDAAILKANMLRDDWRKLHELLHECAEGNIRYTLPVLTFGGHVVAFPTLSRSLIWPDKFRALAKALGFDDGSTLTWEVAYKLLPKNIAQWGSVVGSLPSVTRIAQPHEELHKESHAAVDSYSPPETADRLGRASG